jgi:hypothetical protein
MAREIEDPDQKEIHSYFAENPDAPLPEAKEVVVKEPKNADPGGVGPGKLTGDDDRDSDPREGIRRGDKKIEPDRRRAPPDPPRDTPRARPEEGVDELQRQLARERDQRVRAEQAAAQALQRAQQSDARYGQAATGMIDAAMSEAARASDQAENAFAAAMDIGDHRTAAKAQTALADARANLLKLQEQRQMLQDEAARAEAARKAAPQPRQQPQQMDADGNLRRITAELDRTGYRKSSDWLRQHPDLVRDQEGINRVDGAHGYLVNTLKIPVESERYFDEMERILLDDGDDRDMDYGSSRRSESRNRDDGRREARPAAPVSRSAPSLRSGQVRRTVHLSPEQRQHARDVLGMTDEEYAAELAYAEDHGLMDNGRGRR